MTDALQAITRLIDRRAKTDTTAPIEPIIDDAREALVRLAAVVVAAIVVEQRRQRSALFSSAMFSVSGLPTALADLARTIGDLNSIEGEQATVPRAWEPRSEYDTIILYDTPGRHA